MRKLLVVTLVAVPMLWSCSPAPKGKGEGKTLAVVNGEKITEASLAKEAENLPPYLRPILDTPGGMVQLLDGMITRDLLMREAVRRGIRGGLGGRCRATGPIRCRRRFWSRGLGPHDGLS